MCYAESHRALARNSFIHPFIQQLLAGNLSCAQFEKLGMTQTRQTWPYLCLHPRGR